MTTSIRPQRSLETPIYTFSGHDGSSSSQISQDGVASSDDRHRDRDGWKPFSSIGSGSSSATSSSREAPVHCACLTYNTFSSSPIHASARHASLINTIKNLRPLPDFVGLQEVNGTFEERIKRDEWFRNGWALVGLRPVGSGQGQTRVGAGSEQVGKGKGKMEVDIGVDQGGARDGGGVEDGERGEFDEGVLLLVRKEWLGVGSRAWRLPFMDTRQGKYVIFAELWRDGRPFLRVATSHYEGRADNAPLRKLQYQQTVTALFSDEPPAPTQMDDSEARTLISELVKVGVTPDYLVGLGISRKVVATTLHELGYSLPPALASFAPATAPATTDAKILPATGPSPRVPVMILADFNHSSYSELSPFLNPDHPTRSFLDTHLTSRRLDDPLRSDPTFGQLYPFFEGVSRRERRKPKRLDLVLVAGAEVGVLEAKLVGDQPMRDTRGRGRGRGRGQGRGHGERGRGKGRGRGAGGGEAYLMHKTGMDGLAFPSDHVGVLVKMELTL